MKRDMSDVTKLRYVYVTTKRKNRTRWNTRHSKTLAVP